MKRGDWAVRRELPLFPLHTVLFPGAKLPLQVVEERYKALLQACAEEGDGTVGMVLMRRRPDGYTAPSEVGTIGRIVHLELAPDGHLTAVVRGEQRFRIVEIVQQEPVWVARVEMLPARFSAVSPELTRVANHLAALLYRYLELKAVADQLALADMMLPTDLAALGFRVGALLDVPPHEKQQLLEMDDVTELLRCEVDILRREVRRLQRAAFWNEFLRTARARARAVPPERAIWN